MTRSLVVFIVLSLLPAAAFGQEGLGLDLSEEGQKKEAAKPPETPVAAPAEPAARKPAAKKEEPAVSEREVILEDRVKAVQRKVYLKKHRFELAPFFLLAVNDPYYTKYGFAVRGSYFLTDSLGLSVKGSLFQILPTDDVRVAKRTFQSRIFYSVPIWSLMGDLEWSPLYGKVTIFNSILHFDGYVLGGAGAINTETSTQPGRGPAPAADLGIGLRFVVTDYLAVNAALVNTAYVDQPAGTVKVATQNLLMLNVGASVFFPFRSTGRESE